MQRRRLASWWGLATALALLGCSEAAIAAESQWVRTGVTGRLVYVPDAEGDRILDFSRVGYKGQGAALIPNNVPNVLTLAPIAGDDTAQIQNAINLVSSLPLGPDGFRGAVELGAGHYDVNTQLTIAASGVVLRGVGRDTTDTVLHGRGTGQRPLVRVLGSGSQSLTGNPKRNMIDKVVPAGATSFRVDQTSGLAVGDTVRVERPSTAAWIEALGMDDPPDGDPAWEPGAMNIRFDRTITRIEGNRVFLDAPLANAFEQQFGGGTIQKYAWGGRIENLGVENLRAESDFISAEDENHAWEFVSIENAQNVWVRHTTSRFFGDSAVVSNPTAKWVTVDDAINLDPVSVVTGERRYTFDLSGQLDMVTNSQANNGRHDFVNNSTRPPGPHVFHNSVSNNALNDSGPHQRWATGTLFDNITVNGDNINVRNRGSFGTTHGWAGANMVIWNSQAEGFIVQNPPTAQNWLIGSTGPVINDILYGPQPAGYVDAHGTPVTVGGTNSLYEAQFNDAADVREFHWGGNEASWSDALAWQEALTPGAYRVSSRDYLVGDIDSYTNDGAGSVDNAFIDPTWKSAIQGSSALPVAGLDDLDGNKNVAFTIQHQLGGGERVVHGYLALGLKQSAGGSEVVTDFLRLFDMNAEHRLDFSELGWSSEVNASETFVGVVDMGAYLDKLQTGAVNVQLNDDTGVDWAMYVATVATPIASATGPVVYLDGGGTTVVDAVIAGVGAVAVGGAGEGTLKLRDDGALAIQMDYVQLANGALRMELSSAFPAGAAIAVADDAILAGDLEIELASGFVPALNDSFELLHAIGGIAGGFENVLLPAAPSGLAWELEAGANSIVLTVVTGGIGGDYNSDGNVDAADYTLWRDQLGSSVSLANDDTPGVGMDDYTRWKTNFGQSVGGSGVAAHGVPEPANGVLLFLAAILLSSCAPRGAR